MGTELLSPPKRGTAHNFSRVSIVAKRLHGSRCHLVGGRPLVRRHCVTWAPNSSSQKRVAEPPSPPSLIFGPGDRARGIKIALGMEVGLDSGHVVLDGDPAPSQKVDIPKFSADIYCGQTAGWMKMTLGTVVGIGPDVIVICEDPAAQKGRAP